MATPSSQGYTVYTAKAGDTWDTISYYAYRHSERKAADLIKANRRLGDIVRFEGGEKVKIPIVKTVETPSTLPPWRR